MSANQLQQARCVIADIVVVGDHLLQLRVDSPRLRQASAYHPVIHVVHEKALDFDRGPGSHLAAFLCILDLRLDHGHDEVEGVLKTSAWSPCPCRGAGRR